MSGDSVKFAHSMGLLREISEAAEEAAEIAADLSDEDEKCCCETDAAQLIQREARHISAQVQLREVWEGRAYLPDTLMPSGHSLVEIARVARAGFMLLNPTEIPLIAALGNQISLVSGELQQRHAGEQPNRFQLVASSDEVMSDTPYTHPTGSPRSSDVASHCSTEPGGNTGPWDEVAVAAFLQGFDVRKLISLIDHAIRYKAKSAVKFLFDNRALAQLALCGCQTCREYVRTVSSEIARYYKKELEKDIEALSSSLRFSKDNTDVRDKVVEALRDKEVEDIRINVREALGKVREALGLESESFCSVKRTHFVMHLKALCYLQAITPNQMAGRVKRGPYAVYWEIKPRCANGFERTLVSLVVEREDE